MGNLGNILGLNPQQILNNMLSQNPAYNQAMNMAKQVSGNDPQKAKEIVMEKFKNGNINRNDFEKFSYMAKQL